ncbi:hypothetical protein MBLNU459_g0865t1 [Dothideomycetes sp. NU459]
MAVLTYGQPWCRDGISVRDLSFQYSPHHGLDAWGREKEQPVLLSVSLSFRKSYDTAASNDALDASTIHYGILAKNLRGLKSDGDWQSLDELANRVHKTIMATPPGRDLIESCQIEIKMPKASLLGEYVTYVHHKSDDEESRMLHLSNVFLPTLIGVNSNERKSKQKLFVSLWIGGVAADDAETYTELEQSIEPTAFETLESLAVHVIRTLYKKYSPLKGKGTTVRLRFEKPQAVPFAEAPVIEIFRSSEELTKSFGSS